LLLLLTLAAWSPLLMHPVRSCRSHHAVQPMTGYQQRNSYPDRQPSPEIDWCDSIQPATHDYLNLLEADPSLTCSSNITYLYSTRCPAGSISCEQATRGSQHFTALLTDLGLPTAAQLPAAPAHLTGPDISLVPCHWNLCNAEEAPAKGYLRAPHT
jgi:hypothetical protein